MHKLLEFYNDGLKNHSWIPNSEKEFLEYCNGLTIDIFDNVLVLSSGNKNFRYIDTIYVLKEHRGKGLGSIALDTMCLNSRTALICSDNMLEFYLKKGYKAHLPYTVVIKDNR